MAFSRISAEDVLQNVFEDEQSLDDSDSEDGEDIYGYLGAFVVPRGELEGESRRLSRRRLLDVDGGDDEESSEDENEFNGDFDTQFDEPSLMECDDDGRDETDATGRASLEDQASLTQSGEAVEDEATTEMVRVSEIMQE